MAVDIGEEAIDRGAALPAGFSAINENIAITESGTITLSDIYAVAEITGLKVGIFYKTNGNTLKCRSVQTIPGAIASGSKVSKAVSLAVEIGDYIGCYFTGGEIEWSSSGYTGLWYIEEDTFFVDNETEYDYLGGDAVSIGGYLGAAAAGRSFGFIFG